MRGREREERQREEERGGWREGGRDEERIGRERGREIV